MTGQPTRRPGGVTLVVVLAVLNGLLSIAGGIILILTRNSVEVERAAKAGPTALLVLGVVVIVIGLVCLAVASGLANGNDGSRLITNVFTVLSLLASIWAAWQSTGQAQIQAVGSGLMALVILLALNSAQAKAFFASR